MHKFLTALVVTLPLSGAAFAMGDAPPERQEPVQAAPAPPETAPSDPIGTGIEDFMRNMLTEAQPHLDDLTNDLGGLVGALGPVLSDIGNLMDDVRNYQTPERLENGDILIRRRADAPPPPPVGPALQDMMRPRNDPSRNDPPNAGPDAPQPLPPRDPASEIDL